jgi:branched-chain amino acid transport system permease protein
MQGLINGILIGGVYGGMALGLSLAFGVMKIVNFAHGSCIMAAMYLAYWADKKLGVDACMGMLVTGPVMFGFGYFLQDIFFKPLIKREYAEVVEPLSVVLFTAGLWMILDNLALLFFGADMRGVQSIVTGKTFDLGGFVIDVSWLFAFVVTVVMALIVTFILNKTDFGRAIRATSQDRDAALLQGIDIYRVYSVTFGLAMAMVGVSGASIMTYYYLYPAVGGVFDIKAFVIVILGGMGSVPGAFVGGLIVGLVESLGGMFFSSVTAQVLYFAIFLLILIFRPNGLLGREVIE